MSWSGAIGKTQVAQNEGIFRGEPKRETVGTTRAHRVVVDNDGRVG